MEQGQTQSGREQRCCCRSGPEVSLHFRSEVAQVYASLPPGAAEPPKRLVGWSKVKLKAGESKDVVVEVDPKYLSIFNVEQNGWQLIPGDYGFMVGGSSQDLPLKESVNLK